MQDLLLIAITAAVFFCLLFTPGLKRRMLTLSPPPKRLVIFPIGEDCERLEARLIYERNRARQDGKSTLFLFEKNAGLEACEIARHFSRGEPNILQGETAALREAIGDDAVYKVVEIVLY